MVHASLKEVGIINAGKRGWRCKLREALIMARAARPQLRVELRRQQSLVFWGTGVWALDPPPPISFGQRQLALQMEVSERDIDT